MGKSIKLRNNSHNKGIMRNAHNLKYLRNCGFALRAVPNGTVTSNPNEKITMLFNSKKGNGKRVFGNKTATPLAPLCRSVILAAMRLRYRPVQTHSMGFA